MAVPFISTRRSPLFTRALGFETFQVLKNPLVIELMMRCPSEEKVRASRTWRQDAAEHEIDTEGTFNASIQRSLLDSLLRSTTVTFSPAARFASLSLVPGMRISSASSFSMRAIFQ